MEKISLEQQKEIVFGILCYFDDFCRQNEIDYFLAFGTCLGAARHSGFIPWDDDIDVAMTRTNYNKLLRAWKDTEQYNLLCNEKCGKSYDSPLPKIVDCRTILNQKNRTEKFDLGLYVDVFVLDYVSANKVENVVDTSVELSKDYIWATMKYKFGSLRDLYYDLIKFKRKIRGGGFYTRELARLIESEKRDYSEVTTVINFMLYKKWWPSDLFTKTVELPFNGRNFKVPFDYDKYLTITYGDYMTLPPIEKRVSNHTFEAFWKESIVTPVE